MSKGLDWLLKNYAVIMVWVTGLESVLWSVGLGETNRITVACVEGQLLLAPLGQFVDSVAL